MKFDVAGCLHQHDHVTDDAAFALLAKGPISLVSRLSMNDVSLLT